MSDIKQVTNLSVAERSYLGTKITVVAGDITKLEADAIVNPANSQLIMGGESQTPCSELEEAAFKSKP